MGNLVPLLLSREDLAWAAGFFDGEGCFSFSEAGHYICVSIGQTDREPLDRFRIAVGGLGKVLGPYELARPGRLSKKPQYVYRANRFEHVQAIAAMLWFTLGTPKRNQAREALKKISTCRRGHPRIAGENGCGKCTALYWQSRRQARARTDRLDAPRQLSLAVLTPIERSLGGN